ncbi:MAG: NAD(P)H-dependent oxidoreductase [Rhodoglobus sp.]|nr:NAD(P)H-dependent oxidoreductase [Rhodoglobus sp.]
MTNLMIIVGSVRPGRAGLPVAEWVRETASRHQGFEIDFVDLKELALPFMDEPQHPAKRSYTHDHTLQWSARVDATDAVILVSPEYNHSYSPALKNALDYLAQEWKHKPVGLVSYGGVSGGTRGVAALDPVLTTVGLVKTSHSVEIDYVGKHIEDGVFTPSEKHEALLSRQLDDLAELAQALAPLR